MGTRIKRQVIMCDCHSDLTVPTAVQALSSWKGTTGILSSIILIFHVTYDEVFLKFGQSDLYKSVFGIQQN